MNALKTTLLLGLLTGFLLFIGDYFGGQNGLVIALLAAGVMNFISYFFSDKIALAMYGARAVTRDEAPRVYQIVERLTQRTGLPMPKVFVIPTDSPNAFSIVHRRVWSGLATCAASRCRCGTCA